MQLKNLAARLVLAALASVCACVGVIGCDGPSEVIVLGPRPPRPNHVPLTEDAGFELPEGERACSTDADCADGVECSVDECLPAGYCSNRLDNSLCSDGVLCNGVESCDPQRGCVSAPAPTCDDQDPCTIDRCDEQAKSCVHDIRDFDGDGEADYHCGEGTDCDDFDPLRGMDARELCGDGVDNDCDDRIDEAECGSVPHDTCADPLDISAGGVFELSVVGALSNYSVTCQDETVGRDVVFRFHLDQPRDVKLVAVGLRGDGGQDVANLGLWTTCGMGSTEVQCANGFPGDLRVRSLAAGDYFLVASTTVGARSVLLNASFTAATPKPTNQTCELAQDVGSGGHISGDFVDVGDSIMSSCGNPGQPDLFYKLTLTEPHDVEVAVVGNEQGGTLVALRRGGCAPEVKDDRCDIGQRVLSYYHQLPAGEYTLVVEGPSQSEISFGMDIAVMPPTPPPSGDSCEPAQPLTFGQLQRIPLSGLQDDVATTCQSMGPDAVLSFTLDVAQDLEIRVDGEDSMVTMALQTTCGDTLQEKACRGGQPLRTRLHDVQPGAYFMVVDSPMATTISVQVDNYAPTTAIPVTGNDNCYSAWEIPATGGVFRGDTSLLLQDYSSDITCGKNAGSPDAAFKLTLPTPKRVVARVEATGSYDTVLLRFDAPAAAGGALCAELNPVCDDDTGAGSTPLLDERLPAGTYFYIVDGYNNTNAGEYVLDVAVSDP